MPFCGYICRLRECNASFACFYFCELSALHIAFLRCGAQHVFTHDGAGVDLTKTWAPRPDTLDFFKRHGWKCIS